MRERNGMLRNKTCGEVPVWAQPHEPIPIIFGPCKRQGGGNPSHGSGGGHGGGRGGFKPFLCPLRRQRLLRRGPRRAGGGVIPRAELRVPARLPFKPPPSGGHTPQRGTHPGGGGGREPSKKIGPTGGMFRETPRFGWIPYPNPNPNPPPPLPQGDLSR